MILKFLGRVSISKNSIISYMIFNNVKIVLLQETFCCIIKYLTNNENKKDKNKFLTSSGYLAFFSFYFTFYIKYLNRFSKKVVVQLIHCKGKH